MSGLVNVTASLIILASAGGTTGTPLHDYHDGKPCIAHFYSVYNCDQVDKASSDFSVAETTHTYSDLRKLSMCVWFPGAVHHFGAHGEGGEWREKGSWSCAANWDGAIRSVLLSSPSAVIQMFAESDFETAIAPVEGLSGPGCYNVNSGIRSIKIHPLEVEPPTREWP